MCTGGGAALFDPLTGLPGQALLEERLQRALAESARLVRMIGTRAPATMPAASASI